jgi:hypothetical protein
MIKKIALCNFILPYIHEFVLVLIVVLVQDAYADGTVQIE